MSSAPTEPRAPASWGGGATETDALTALAPYMGVFFVAFFVVIAVTPLLRRLAVANGIVDWPDLKRKNHALPVAYLGGVAIFVGWVAGVFASYLVASDELGPSFPVSIMIGAGVITLTGLIDDAHGLSPRAKVGGQLFAAAALTWNQIGIQVTEQVFALLGFSPPSTVVYFAATVLVAVFVLGGCNAVNLIDGLDGLATGVVLIAMCGFLAIALCLSDVEAAALDNPQRIVLCLATIGALLGFLPYNFSPAAIFMGDAGSLLLGFLSVSAILLFGDVPALSLKLVTASLIVFAVPITDTSLAIVRRKLRGQPIMSPDNQHLHHLLRKAGLSVKKSVLVLYAVAVAFGVLGVLTVALEFQWRYSLAILSVLYGSIMVLAFKYGAYCMAIERQQAKSSAQQAIAGDAPIDRLEIDPKAKSVLGVSQGDPRSTRFGGGVAGRR